MLRGLRQGSKHARVSVGELFQGLSSAPYQPLQSQRTSILADFWRSFSASGIAGTESITLNNLADNPGAQKTGKRLGRGIGSGKGKTSGRGHKGQKARTGRQVKMGFEGGQTPIKRYTPKRGFHNPFSMNYVPLNLSTLSKAIEEGRLAEQELITIKSLRDTGVIHRHIKDGVKLLGRGASEFSKRVNIQVSQVSEVAKQAIESKGGKVTTVYYNDLGLRALVSPDWFAKKGRQIPKPARPHPKKRNQWDAIGSLPPTPEIRPLL